MELFIGIIAISLLASSINMHCLAQDKDAILELIAAGSDYNLSLIRSGRGKAELKFTKFKNGAKYLETAIKFFFAFENDILRWDRQSKATFVAGRTVTDRTETRNIWYKQVLDGERLITYMDGSNTAIINRPITTGTEFMTKFDPLFIGVKMVGEPLSKYIKRCKNRIIALKETEYNGNKCFVLSIAGNQGTRGELWINAEKGFTLARSEVYDKGSLATLYECEMKEYPNGIWFLDSLKVVFYDPKPEGGSEPGSIRIWHITECKLNAKIDDSTFTMEGLGVPEDARVIDYRFTPHIVYKFKRTTPDAEIEKKIRRIIEDIKRSNESEIKRKSLMLLREPAKIVVDPSLKKKL